MTSVARFVRLPFTTLLRIPVDPFEPPPLGTYVTTPPDCAPRIMVMRTIVRKISKAVFRRSGLMTITPKLPHRNISRQWSHAGPSSSKRSEHTLSSAVSQAAACTDECSFQLVVAAAKTTLPSHPPCRTTAARQPVTPGTRTRRHSAALLALAAVRQPRPAPTRHAAKMCTASCNSADA